MMGLEKSGVEGAVSPMDHPCFQGILSEIAATRDAILAGILLFPSLSLQPARRDSNPVSPRFSEILQSNARILSRSGHLPWRLGGLFFRWALSDWNRPLFDLVESGGGE
jgi:hypothetical protein